MNVSATMVSPGLWETDLGQTGPFGGPAPAGRARVSATSVGRLFDPAVAGTAVSGDLFIDSFDFFTDAGDELTNLPYHYTVK